MEEQEPEVTFTGRIILIMGCMFSGKSTELTRIMSSYKNIGWNSIMFSYILDNIRNGEGITTHNNHKYGAIQGDSLETLWNQTSDQGSIQVVGIDEGQFFDDISTFSERMANQGKIVIISALDSTWERELFPNIAKLIPKCDQIIKLYALCHCGKEAAFSKRIKKGEGLVMIGGNETYRASCRLCFNRVLTLTLTHRVSKERKRKVQEETNSVSKKRRLNQT